MSTLNKKPWSLRPGTPQQLRSARCFWRALLVVASICALAASGLAQSAGTGALTGTLTDPSGAVVNGARVTATNEATGEMRTTVSRGNGLYTIPLLPPGSYRVQFIAPGFKQAVKPGLQINVTETSRLDIRLEIGTAGQEVTVSTETVLLQTESSALGRGVDSVVVSNLPLVTRNYTQIVKLSPGIAADVTNASELGRGTGGESGGDFRTHGGFGLDNNFQMNGVQINDLQGSGSFSGGIAIPNPDAVQEFKVQTGQYDAAYGRNAGANVDVVTKSGTNQFHGTVFEFFRNDALNANEFFRNRAGQERGVLRQNQFGFALGGPLKRDKVMFFGSYQGTRQLNGLSPDSTASISSPAFTDDRSPAALGALFGGRRGLLQDLFGGVGPAIAADGSNISPQALALLNLRLPNGQFVIPTPQTIDPSEDPDLQGFSAFSVPGRFDEDQFLLNLDFLHTAKSRFGLRFFSADSNQDLPLPVGQLGEPSAPGFPFLIPNNFRNASLNHVYVVNPHLVNYANFGFHRTDVGNQQQEVFTWSDIGASAPPIANLFPVIGVAGSMELGGNGQSVRAFQQHFNFEDSLTYVRGRHTFRFGGGYTHSRVSLANFTFFGAALFLSWPDFLLGLPAGPEAAGGNGTPFSNIFLSLDIPGDLDRSWIIHDGNAYIQDDIKVNSSLTLNLGLRYERLGHLADTGGRNSGFDINLANPNPPAAGSLEGFLVSENFPGNVPAGVTQLDNRFGTHGKGQNTWAPRIGVAWRLPDSFLPFTERMVLRGGYGIYHTRATGQAFLQLAASRPFAELRLFSGLPNGAASFASPFQPQPALPAFAPYSPTTQLSTLLVDPDYRPPLTQEFSLNLQADLGLNSLLEVGYVGARGSHLITRRSLNQAELASPSNPIRGETSNSADNIPLRVPILGFTADGIGDIESAANSWYHGLETSLTKRFSRGLEFLASYTFAHAYSDSASQTGATGFGISGNQANRRANYGRTDLNREHRFVFSYVYELPSVKRFNGFVDKLLGGWSVAGVTTIQSGAPLTLTGSNAFNVFGITDDRADLVPDCNLNTPGSVSNRLDAYLNANCIARLDPNAPFDATANPAVWPVIGDDGVATGFGNSRPGIVMGPGQNNSDIAIIKRTPVGFLGEGSNIEFRAEFFNAFNHPQFDLPDADVTSSTFGVISETAVSPRIIQFGLKVNF